MKMGVKIFNKERKTEKGKCYYFRITNLNSITASYIKNHLFCLNANLKVPCSGVINYKLYFLLAGIMKNLVFNRLNKTKSAFFLFFFCLGGGGGGQLAFWNRLFKTNDAVSYRFY